MQTARFEYLFRRYLQKTYTHEEREEFFALLEQPGYQALLDGLSARYDVPDNQAPLVDEQAGEQMLEAIFKASKPPLPATKPAGLVHMLYKWRWAAAIIILATTGAYLGLVGKKNSAVRESPLAIQTTAIAPGINGAVLTLANGRQVVLDSMRNGMVTTQNGTQVMLKNGQLIYDPVTGASDAIASNTVNTPRGRQFRLVLPDGTRVWLNAASSLTYPTAFTGKERRVEVTGEAYFEVAKNEQMPFMVNINDAAAIEVLGTRFNVNAYKDEAGIKTTLLEGAVRMRSGKNSAVLKPGQAARISAGSGPQAIEIINNEDPGKVLAWKSGFFHFENASLEEVMRQLARWYDIEVVYEKGIPPIVFGGKMSRDVMLSDLLKVLEDSEVHFRTEGRRLVVMP